MLLLSSLPKSYEGIVDTLVYGRETLDMNEVRVALDTKESQKKGGNQNSKSEVLWVKENKDRGKDFKRRKSRGKSQGRYGRGRSIVADENTWDL